MQGRLNVVRLPETLYQPPLHQCLFLIILMLHAVIQQLLRLLKMLKE